MGLLTDATVRVRPVPEHESFHVLFFPDWSAGAAAVREAVQSGIELSMLRLSNPTETQTLLKLAGHEWSLSVLEGYLGMRGASSSKCMLTFGVTGRRDQCSTALQQALALFRARGCVSAGSGLGRRWARSRFRSPYLRDSLWALGYAVDTLETAVDWPRVDRTMWGVERALRRTLEDEGEPVHVFTHLAHIYPQGSSIYTTCLFRVAESYEATLERWRRLKHAASREIVSHGGTISHQHGVGTDHAPYLAAEKGTLGIAAIRAACTHFDPDGMMNPGKLVPD